MTPKQTMRPTIHGLAARPGPPEAANPIKQAKVATVRIAAALRRNFGMRPSTPRACALLHFERRAARAGLARPRGVEAEARAVARQVDGGPVEEPGAGFVDRDPDAQRTRS